MALRGVTIRPVQEADFRELTVLVREFHEFHVRAVPDHLKYATEAEHEAALREGLKSILGNGRARLLVACVDGHVVGFVEAYVHETEPSPFVVQRRWGLVQSLMVLPAFRGMGIGTLLMEHAHRWLREQAATEVRVDVWEFEDGPLGFYERLGYRTLRRTLVRGL
ncbi:MAG: GNAT family N-acetyltransferase [Bacillota bacterium]